MKLAALYNEQNVLIHLDAPDMDEAIHQLIAAIADQLGRLTPEAVAEILIRTEEELPVGMGHGVRVPHARLGGITRLITAIGTSQEGIPVTPGSEERAHLIFLVLTPKTQSTLMLQTMASIARLVSNEDNRRALITTRSPQKIIHTIEETGIEVKKAIVAADLITPYEFNANPDMTLRQVVQVMVNCREEGLPVIDADGDFLGDLSTRMVIEVGLPKYMNLISNPNILTEFEPFEAFYKKEDSVKASEIMNSNVLRLPPETPVEIVAHEMLAKRCERAYIVEDKKLLGIVYRKDIVRKVLNL
ncbi:TPA: hypothetical protein DDW35_06515 [Candidatus Sumerlaeota bacterium]|nr:hypothetical protein [Candidatus Sumerlaeota bacterium]